MSQGLRKTGFTLAELLIALAILGIIATFSIPKVLTSQQDSQKKSVFRESVAAVSDALYSGLITTGFTVSGDTRIFFRNKINAIKLCPSNAETEGCWQESTQGDIDALGGNGQGFVLANGAVLAGVGQSALEISGADRWIIDYNGTTGPNQQGQDQMLMSICHVHSDPSFLTYCDKPGQVHSHRTAGSVAANKALFESIFSN